MTGTCGRLRRRRCWPLMGRKGGRQRVGGGRGGVDAWACVRWEGRGRGGEAAQRRRPPAVLLSHPRCRGGHGGNTGAGRGNGATQKKNTYLATRRATPVPLEVKGSVVRIAVAAAAATARGQTGGARRAAVAARRLMCRRASARVGGLGGATDAGRPRASPRRAVLLRRLGHPLTKQHKEGMRWHSGRESGNARQ